MNFSNASVFLCELQKIVIIKKDNDAPNLLCNLSFFLGYLQRLMTLGAVYHMIAALS
jgi:hypothetical protein